MAEIKLGNLIVTLGTDLNRKFAWCLRKVNDVNCICLHEREGGMSCFNEQDFITAIPLERVESCAKLLIKNKRV